MDRITIKHLETLCDRVNTVTQSPMQAYMKGDDGRYHANIGNYHLSQAYGGVMLVRMATDGGGVSCPLVNGHVPKRVLYGLMQAFLTGLRNPDDVSC